MNISGLKLITCCQAGRCLCVGLLCLFPALTQGGDPCVPNYSGQQDVGAITTGTIDEASGIAASRRNPGVFYTHNDSGDPNRIFAINADGDFLAEFTIDGFASRDWEDVAVGPGPVPGVNYIYIANIGDNGAQYDLKYIARISEPAVGLHQAYAESTLYGAETMTITYPDGRRDAETLMVDPWTKDIFIVSKRENTDVRLYRAAWPQSTSSTITLELSRTLPLGWIVGGDISPSGERIVIKHGAFAYYWCRQAGQSVSDAMGAPPTLVPYVQEQQGEAICWALDESGYYTLSEGHYEHVFFYEDLEAPIDADDPELNFIHPTMASSTTVFDAHPIIAGTVSDNEVVSLVTYSLSGATDGIGIASLYDSVLIPVGSIWKYAEDGADLGTGWRVTLGNDSSWGRGPAQLGYGDGDEATVLNYGNDPSQKPITTYYRHVFQVDESEPYNVPLQLQVLHDDGIIVYLNGQEVLRNNMPTGEVDYLTPATTTVSGGDENTWITTTIPAGHIQSGPNLLAVELHQRTTASSDLSFDLGLSAGEVDILWAVDGVTLNEGVTTVRVTAKDGAENKATERIDILYSSLDTGSPTIEIQSPTTAATYSTNTSSIVLGGTVTDNQAVASVNVALSGATTGSFQADLQDALLVLAGAEWKYVEDGSDQGTGWHITLSNDSGWGSGPAPLGYGNGDEQTVLDSGTDPNAKPITTYFRHVFQLDPQEVQVLPLRLRLVRDDGAVVYLNGIEIFRDNMPGGVVTYLTPASQTMNAPEETEWIDVQVPSGHLQAGQNLLAIEIHQKSAASSDVRMDCELAYDTSLMVWGLELTNFAEGVTDVAVTAVDSVGNTSVDSLQITRVQSAPSQGGGGAVAQEPELIIPSINLQLGIGVIIQWVSVEGSSYRVLKCISQEVGYEELAAGILATPPLNTYTDAAPPSTFSLYSVEEE